MKNAYILFSLLLSHFYNFALDDPSLIKYPLPDLSSYQLVDITQDPTGEGIAVGTLIKTADGYIPIEGLQKCDKIIGHTPDGLEEKEVLHTFLKLLPNPIEIVTNHATILSGPRQKFYSPSTGSWIEAKDLTPDQLLLRKLAEYAVVRQTKQLQQSIAAYVMTVQGHTFYVTQDDICVHNSDALCEYGPIILHLGFVVCKHPIIELLGTGLNILQGYTVVHNLLRARMEQQISRASTTVQTKVSQEQIVYKTVKQELEGIKKSFIQTIDDLKSFKTTYHADFTYDFLNSYATSSIDTILDTAAQDGDALYNDTISKLRETELHRLEQEIIDLQITLAVHFYRLVENRNNAFYAAQTASQELGKLAKTWNASNLYALSVEVTLSYYDKENLIQELLQDLEDKNNELSLAIRYYTSSRNSSAFKRTSNIADSFAQEEQNSAHVGCFLQKTKSIVAQHKQVTAQHFQQLNVHQVNYSYANTAQRKKEKKAKDLIEAKQQRSSIVVPPQDPKKNDKDKDKHPHGKYEDAPHHHQNSKGVKNPAPKNGQKALDESYLVVEKGNNSYQRRIGVSEDQYVVLDQTSEGVFHGHTREWSELTDKMQAILRKEGKVL